MSDIMSRQTPTDAEYKAEFEHHMREIDRMLEKMEQGDAERERQRAESSETGARIDRTLGEIKRQVERLWGPA